MTHCGGSAPGTDSVSELSGVKFIMSLTLASSRSEPFGVKMTVLAREELAELEALAVDG